MAQREHPSVKASGVKKSSGRKLTWENITQQERERVKKLVEGMVRDRDIPDIDQELIMSSVMSEVMGLPASSPARRVLTARDICQAVLEHYDTSGHVHYRERRNADVEEWNGFSENYDKVSEGERLEQAVALFARGEDDVTAFDRLQGLNERAVKRGVIETIFADVHADVGITYDEEFEFAE